MEFPSYRKPYSHRTRFKLVHSTTTLVKVSKATTTTTTTAAAAAAIPTSRFKLVRNGTQKTQPALNSSKTSLLRVKNTEKSLPSTALVKNIENKYKWIRTSLRKTNRNSFKLDRRKPTSSGRVAKRKPHASLSKCLVRIRGIKFQTHPNGKCLQRLVSDPDASKTALSSIPVKKTEDPIRSKANVLLQRSIHISNGCYRLRNRTKKSTSLRKKKNCIYFNRFGKCHRGDECPFLHDRTRIAVCTQFLNGRCKNSSCPYSHELTPGKVPTCSFFMKGACGQDNCPYAHSFVGADAQICDDFVQGFCAKGIECPKQHVLLCPQFESTGQCPRGKQCHLTHRRKRSENKLVNLRIPSSKKVDQTESSLPSVMPAYIPLTSEPEKTSPTSTELKLRPSFLS
ncbi:unnamed protein product [Adineta ricciae]|uniref:C3H1-type domain-containing protein n=1 Tax=Adineta ricciae TaxID=249248 RepID=A0A814MQQ1_ADIRI|nr:unnamed protein product [Adineta ricciae]